MGTKRSSKSTGRREQQADGGDGGDGGDDGAQPELVSEEEYRKKFEPVAPWKRKGIPDRGPLADAQHALLFAVVGVVATLVYELTDYFDEINRLLAYVAIWFPLWFRLLSRVSPALSDEELERREKLEFQRQLDHLVQDEDQVDD